MSNPANLLMIIILVAVIGNVLVKIIHGPKEVRKAKRREMRSQQQQQRDEEQVILEEIYHGLADLGKRIENLETILGKEEEGDE